MRVFFGLAALILIGSGVLGLLGSRSGSRLWIAAAVFRLVAGVYVLVIVLTAED
jgi:hypothetical protein